MTGRSHADGIGPGDDPTARLRELESERDTLKHNLDAVRAEWEDLRDLCAEYKAERDAATTLSKQACAAADEAERLYRLALEQCVRAEQERDEAIRQRDEAAGKDGGR